MDMDEVDLRILDLLQADASGSNMDLAARANVSAATCFRRVRRLVDGGVIERRVALVNAERVGLGLTVLIEVTLDHQGAEHLAAFQKRAVADTAVQQCYRVSPGPDFMLVVWCSDMPDYQLLVDRLLTQDANVRQVKAFFSVQRAKFEPAVNLRATRPAR